MPCFENVIVKNDPFKYICPCKFEEKKTSRYRAEILMIRR